MDEIREIALRIKELREICDYSVDEIAKELKIAVSDLEIISGHTDHFKKIYINLSVTPEAEEKLVSLKKEK